MKKIIAIITVLSIICLAGCATPTVSQAEYDALKAELEQMKSTASETPQPTPVSETNTSAPVQTTNVTTKDDGATAYSEGETQEENRFDAKAVVAQLDVKDYLLNRRNYCYAIFVIRNNSDYTLVVNANVKFYDESGNIVGANSNDEPAIGSGCEIALIVSTEAIASSIEYEISAKEDISFGSIQADLSPEVNISGDKAIISLTNNGSLPGRFVEGSALFFDGEQIVEYDDTYFTDEDSEIKPGTTITEELKCREPFDSVQVYFTGRTDK